jgi:ArsR family transcriptional regulator
MADATAQRTDSMALEPSTVFTALAHDTRLRCLLLLLRHRELCVCELTRALGASQPHVSRHLAHLREAGLVSDRREGLWIHYQLAPDSPGWVRKVLQATAQGVREESPFAEDTEALAVRSPRAAVPHCA